MGDTTGLYLSYESAIEQFNQRNFLMAAVEAYWCLQYCYYGEPYGIKDLHCYEREYCRHNFPRIKKDAW